LIILFPPGGRTGNQLFQTAYCMTLAGPRGMDTGMVSLYIDVEPDPLQWSAPGGQGLGRVQTVNPL